MATIIVVGSGAAGLTVAREASRTHDVVLLMKGALGDSNSSRAQGGIAAATGSDDSIELHLADTLTAGAGEADERIARILCAEGPARIADLLRFGMPFDRHDGDVARAREGAHSVARVLHAGGDSTGRSLIHTLSRAVRESKVSVRENTFVADVVVADGRVRGVQIVQSPRGLAEFLAADAVVIATGGAGQLFEHTTNPLGATGDGIAAAARAGAILGDLEFYQFHPTALAVECTPLVSEAVRGSGAHLLDIDGRRFMLAEHPDAELAPRDVVARAIARTMAGQNGTPVLLDARSIAAVARRFPGFAELCATHGFDPATEPVPVTPAAHYWMGGIVVDDRGRTSIPGMYAVGEAACTGVHGANRLASNSLLETLVFGHRVAEDLAQLEALGEEAWVAPPDSVSAPASRESRGAHADRGELQQLMWRAAGLERNAKGLAEAAATLASWTTELPDNASVAERETANLLLLARELVSAAAARRITVGAHFRSDSPATDSPASDHLSTSARKVALSC